MIAVSKRISFGVGDLFSAKLIGTLGELQPANYLRDYNYRIFFPPGSKGPADFLAIRGTLILAVQCKSTQSNLGDYDTDALLRFAAPIEAVPVFTSRISGRVKWHLHIDGKWREIHYPKWNDLRIASCIGWKSQSNRESAK